MRRLNDIGIKIALAAALSGIGARGIAADESVEGLFEVEPDEFPAASQESSRTNGSPPADSENHVEIGEEVPNSGTSEKESPQAASDISGGRDELFGSDTESSTTIFNTTDPASNDRQSTVNFSGFWQNELAFAFRGDSHFSKWKNVGRLTVYGTLSEKVKWQVSGHLIYDPIYKIDGFYPDRVEDNQELDGYFHETFVDVSAGDWEIRLGRQNIVWGESVGLFFADVVSALDLREFVLPDFELMRIPQWAIRSEYFKDEFHVEFVWIPVATTDEIGEFGAEFFPFNVQAPPGFGLTFIDEEDQRNWGEDYAAGSRVSFLKGGWDLSFLYHTTPDHTAAFAREISLEPFPLVTYRGIHQRIHQFGGTLAKDIGDTIFKAEAVYTKDRLQTVLTPLDSDGLFESNELRYLIGLDWAIGEHNFNAQFFQTWFQDHQPTMIPDEIESGISVLFRTAAISPDLEPEILWIRSLNRDEWLLEAKISWKFTADWRWTFGTDIFEGPRDSFLGQFNQTSRVYSEVRFSF